MKSGQDRKPHRGGDEEGENKIQINGSFGESVVTLHHWHATGMPACNVHIHTRRLARRGCAGTTR